MELTMFGLLYAAITLVVGWFTMSVTDGVYGLDTTSRVIAGFVVLPLFACGWLFTTTAGLRRRR